MNFKPTLYSATQAVSAQEFMDSIRKLYGDIRLFITSESSSPRKRLDEFDQFLKSSDLTERERKILSLSIWPLLDASQLDEECPDAYLRLFAIPVVIRTADRKTLFRGSGALSSPQQLLIAFSDLEYFNEKAELRLFSTVFSRHGLTRLTPRELMSAALNGELNNAFSLTPENEDLSFEKCATVFFIGAARLPINERTLFKGEFSSPKSVQNEVKQALNKALGAHSIQIFKPCSIAEAQFYCRGAGVKELEWSIAGAQSCQVRFVAEGVAELFDPETDRLLHGPFEFFEPLEEVAAAVALACSRGAVPFSGAFRLTTLSQRKH